MAVPDQSESVAENKRLREERDRWEALARRLYGLMGEEGERLLPGDLESSELLRVASDEEEARP
jgi:hypothetical protein